MNFRRFLNNAEIASSIIGSNYTFFVPVDDAFEKYGFEELPDEVLSSNRSVKMILNHFVKGRLYDRDLKENEIFESVGGRPLKISRDSTRQVSVNQAKIIESEVFVYNLGTMYFVDDILYPETLRNDAKEIPQISINDRKEGQESSEEFYTTEMPIYSEKERNRESTTAEYKSILSTYLTTRDVELIAPARYTEFAEDTDFLMTPRTLPIRYEKEPPK